MQKRQLLLIVILVLLVFSLNLFQIQVRDFFYSLSNSIQEAFWLTGSNISDFFGGIFRKDDLVIEIKTLRLENQRLLAELAELKTLKEENKTLREALEIGLVEDFQLAFAKVTGRDATQDSILIDKGSIDGLSEGLSVITEQRVLLGKIDEVYKNFARVTLISNKKSVFDAEILERNIEGLVRGQGNQRIYLDLIPRDKTLKEGDLVVSSSLGGVYPKGLLVGLIREVRQDDVNPFQQAEISSFFKLRELRNVFIILK